MSACSSIACWVRFHVDLTPLLRLIRAFAVSIYKADPDVIVGHDFLGVSLDILLHRMCDLKADQWSHLRRFGRYKRPNIGRQGLNIKFSNGRVLCDLVRDCF